MNQFIYEAILSVHIYSDISCFLCQFQFFISVINQNHDLAALFPCKTKSKHSLLSCRRTNTNACALELLSSHIHEINKENGFIILTRFMLNCYLNKVESF